MLPKGQSLIDDYEQERPSQQQRQHQSIQTEYDSTPPQPRQKLIVISIILIFFYVLLVLTNSASRKNSLIIKQIVDSENQKDEITKEIVNKPLQNNDQSDHQKQVSDEQDKIEDQTKHQSDKQQASRIHQDSIKQVVQWSASTPKDQNSKRSKVPLSGKQLILRGYRQVKPQSIEHSYYSQQLDKIVNEIQLQKQNKKVIEAHQKLVSVYQQIRDDIDYNIFFSPSQKDLTLAIQAYLKSKPLHQQLKLLEDNSQLDLTLSQEQVLYFKNLDEKYSFKSRKNHSLCIMVSTHNNAKNKQIHRTLHSIFNQDYDKYQVVIANYQSNDATLPLIHAFLQKDQSFKNKTTVLSYESQSQPQAVWHAAKYCKNDSFIVYLDGNTEILGKRVFQVIDALINTSKSTFLYSDYFSYDYQIGAIKYEKTQEYDQSEQFLLLYRKLPNKYGKMVVFKAQSLKNMPAERFSFNGNSFVYTGIDSILYTLLQMSCGRSKKISQPLFFNLKDSSREKRIKQEKKHQYFLISEKLKTDIC